MTKSNNKRVLTELIDIEMRNPKRQKRSKASKQFQAIPMQVPAANGMIIRRAQVPDFRTVGNACVVSNTELFATVSGAAAGVFNLTRTFLIPGFMPWVSGVSINFSKWRWVRLRLIFVPSCSTATSGTITMSLGYDNTDTTPGGIAAAQAAYRSETFPPWGGVGGIGALNDASFTSKPPQSVIVDVDTKRLTLPWYPYTNTPQFLSLTGADRNAFNPAYLDIGQLGVSSTAVVGSIFAKYEIELIEPISATINS